MQRVTWENKYRTTMVCVDSYENGVLSGRMYNPYLPSGEQFHSTIDFLKKMESLLDQMKFPQSFSASRVFRDTPDIGRNALPNEEQTDGLVGTFSLRVIFRQNSSWQGNIAWQEGRQDASFRSVLELLFLIDSAISAEQGNEQQNMMKTHLDAFSYDLQSYEVCSAGSGGVRE